MKYFALVPLLLILIVARESQKTGEPRVNGRSLSEWLRDVDNPDSDIRLHAVEAIEMLGAKAVDAVPELIRILEKNENHSRREAIYLLGTIGPDAQAAVPTLIKTLSHEDFHTQYWTCRTLAKIGPAAKKAVPQLLVQMKEGVTSVRRNAAMALGQMGPDVGEEAILALADRLRDKIQPVRADAATALGKLGPAAKSAAPALREAIKKPGTESRTESALALWKITQEVEFPLLVLIEQLADPSAPWDAAEAIGKMGPAAKRAVGPLTKLLESDDAESRMAAAIALGEIGPDSKPAILLLQQLADDDDDDVSAAAKTALQRIAPELVKQPPSASTMPPIRHSLFIAGPTFTGILDEDGQETWNAGKPAARDGFVLPNGNVLIAWSDEVRELTRDKKELVFHYVKSVENNEIGTVQRLDNGRTLITELGKKPRLLEVDETGKIALEFALLPETDNAHMQTRMARKLPGGTYLVPHLLAFKVKEYDPSGKLLSEFRTDLESLGGRQAENWPFTAIRLANGNTLVNLTHGNKTVELNRKGEIAWQIGNGDFAEKPFADPCGGQRLPNGNTVIASYGAKGDPGVIKVFEVTPEKKLVWTYTGPHRAHEIQVLTTNGRPIEGKPQK